MYINTQAVKFYEFHPDVFITSESAFSGGLFLLFWNKTVYCEQEVALEIIISILHSENSLYKDTSPAPEFDKEAELLLCLRDAQLLAKHGALLFM